MPWQECSELGRGVIASLLQPELCFSGLLHTVVAGLMGMKKACCGFETSKFYHVYLCVNEFQCALETNRQTKTAAHLSHTLMPTYIRITFSDGQ